VSGSNKTLWAALLVLIVVVLAMGAALIRIQNRPIEPRMVWVAQHGELAAARSGASATVVPTSAVASAASSNASSAASSSSATTTSHEQNMSQGHINTGQSAINTIANPTIEITAKPRPVLPRAPEPAVLRAPARGASVTATP